MSLSIEMTLRGVSAGGKWRNEGIMVTPTLPFCADVLCIGVKDLDAQCRALTARKHKGRRSMRKPFYLATPSETRASISLNPHLSVGFH
jgi:hypothetical protein